MGMIYLSKKTKRSPVVGARYWADRQMTDFLPVAAYDVPFDGGKPSPQALQELQTVIRDMETVRNSREMTGVHIELHDHGYLTITIGSFAT